MSRSKLAVLTPTALLVRAQSRALAGGSERGDIPGWVLITIMTAGLVTVVWGVADNQLSQILNKALNSVTGP